MLIPMTNKEIQLTVRNVVSACYDINKLNRRGYSFLYIASGFIAHYSVHGFKDYYSNNSLAKDILHNHTMNQWNNFHQGEADYEYYMAKKKCYNAICEGLKPLANKLHLQSLYTI